MDVLFQTADADGTVMVLPVEIAVGNMPQVGNTANIAQVTGVVTAVEHFYGETCYIHYAGNRPSETCWGVTRKFRTLITISDQLPGGWLAQDWHDNDGWEIDHSHITYHRG